MQRLCLSHTYKKQIFHDVAQIIVFQGIRTIREGREWVLLIDGKCKWRSVGMVWRAWPLFIPVF